MDFSPQQAEALKAISKWTRSPRRSRQQIFRLFGYAGTGKTTIAKTIADNFGGAVQFCAFTGKAAHVMQQKGCGNAATIHSLIYKAHETSQGYEFELNRDAAIGDVKLIIVDECSMVGNELAQDLLSFKVPVLVLGDPAQLPPVNDAGFFTHIKEGDVMVGLTPDVMLTEIHRQARDDPIIAIATDIRMGKGLKPGTYGESIVAARAPYLAEAMEADQILVGRNATRRSMNAKYRKHKEMPATYPVQGDRLVCLRNKHDKGLLNGSLWEVTTPVEMRGLGLCMKVKSLDGIGIEVDVRAHADFFTDGRTERPHYELKGFDQFDFGYALTCHKSQGSQWDSVLIMDEGAAFREDADRWRYTAITRAAQKVTVLL